MAPDDEYARRQANDSLKESFDEMAKKQHREPYEPSEAVSSEPSRGTRKQVHIEQYDTDSPEIAGEVDRLRSAYQQWKTEQLAEHRRADMEDDGVEGDWTEYANDPDHELDPMEKGVMHSTALDAVYAQKQELGHDFSPAAVYRFCEETEFETPEEGLFIQAAATHASDDAQVLPDLAEDGPEYIDGLGFRNDKTLIIEGAPELGSRKYRRGGRFNTARSKGDLIFLDRDSVTDAGIRGRGKDREGENVYVTSRQIDESTYEVAPATASGRKMAIQAARTETSNVIERGRELLDGVIGRDTGDSTDYRAED